MADHDAAWQQRCADARRRLGQELAVDQDDSATDRLARLCRTLAHDLPSMGVAVNLMSITGSNGVAASSDDRIRSIDEIQFTTGEGPCMDAFTQGRPVLVSDLHSDGRWPAYATTALSSGTGAVFAFPLQAGTVRFGVMDVFFERAGSMSAEQVTTAQIFAQIATEIMLEGSMTTATGDLESHLSTALDYRTEVYQAQGMVMIDLGLQVDAALALMRAFAFAHEMPLINLARDIIGGFVLPRDGVK